MWAAVVTSDEPGAAEEYSLATLSADPFVYVWAYRVLPERVDEFRRLYGPDGEWVRLFRQSRGYLSTNLYRDRNWISAAASFNHLF